MKLSVQQLYRSIPPWNEDFSLVTRELLANKPGYRISFVDLKWGLLRKTFGRSWLSAPEWLERHGLENGRGNYPLPEWVKKTSSSERVLYASEEGLSMIAELGYTWFREEIYHPEIWSGAKIGHGSESLCYRAALSGRDVVVKLQNKEGIEKLNCFAYKSYYNPPDYLYKFGVTPQVSRILSSMQESGFFTTFEIKPSPCEYVVGKNFLVEEYVPGPNLRKINEKMQKTTNKTVYGRRKEFWAKWFSSFKEEQISLEELFFLVGTERGEPFTQTDFNFPDWILRGYNSSSGRVQLSLIDQTPAGVAYDISMYPIIEQEKEEKKETLRQKWNKRPELEHLMHYSL